MGPVLIAGCHRSGTSAISRLFNVHGLDLGHFAAWSGPDNPTGFWEDRRMLQANETLLEEADATWRKPVIVDRDLREEGLNVDLLLDDKFMGLPGFKDPRFCWTWPTWKRAWPEAVLIGVLRNPEGVYKSLSQRNGLESEEIDRLWEDANSNLSQWGAQWVHFPTGQGLRAAIEKVGLEYHPELLEKVIVPDIVHYSAEESRSRLYQEIFGSIEPN